MDLLLSPYLLGWEISKGQDQTSEIRGGKYAARVQTGYEKDGSPKYRYFKTMEEYEAYMGAKKKKKDSSKDKKKKDSDKKKDSEKADESGRSTAKKTNSSRQKRSRSIFTGKVSKSTVLVLGAVDE